jgi:hypothetical protein
MDEAELEALAVWDASVEHAELRLELLHRESAEAAAEDLVDRDGQPPALAYALGLRRGRPVTIEQAAERTGLEVSGELDLLRLTG